MIPNARITSLLAEVHRWTGVASVFTHQQTDLPADDPRVVLSTGVLAEGETNLGLSRTGRRLLGLPAAASFAWTRRLAHARGKPIGRHSLCWSTHNSVSHSPPCSGAADVSSSDGQGFPYRRTRRGGPGVPSMRTTGARCRRCSTHMFRRATPRTTRLPSRPRARPPTSSTGCSTMRQTSASPSITPTAAASVITALLWPICWDSVSHHASPISPSVGSMASDRPRTGRRSRRSSPGAPTNA